LVVEDEASIRKELIAALNEMPELEVAGEADSVEDAFDLVKNTPAEVLFLDIKLIGGTAFHLLNMLKLDGCAIPHVVINTGYRDFEYAQRLHNEFGKEVIAILKKPFYEDWERHKEKILEAIYFKQQQERRIDNASMPAQKMLNIQDGRQSYLVNSADIVMVKTGPKGQGKTEVILERHTIHCNLSLSQLLARMPGNFFQINRFEAINIQWISVVNHSERQVCLRNGGECSIGEPFFKDLLDALPK
jgi:DNA-binding LytR/AlgR family response regulator